MRCVLIDHARGKARGKRGGSKARVALDGVVAASAGRGVDLLALEEALKKLERENEARARLVELRYFGGLTLEEAGEMLGISLGTVKREWSAAKVWLFLELGHGTGGRGE
jgi:RNA polymerase sigma factor (TIGR02999 family)